MKNQTWEPKYGDTYWYISLGVHGIKIKSSVRSTWFWHEQLAKTGNCFPSPELAEQAAEQIKALLKEFHKNNP